MLWRYGLVSNNAGSVDHAHGNVMEPNGTGEVRLPLFKLDEDRETNAKRMAGFAARYETGEVPA